MSETLVRYVPPRKIARGDHNEILGPTAEAFKLRKHLNEPYLSINIREIASDDPITAIREIATCHLTKGLKVRRNSIYTQGIKDDIFAVFFNQLTLKPLPKKSDPSYAGLSGFPEECDEELEALALTVWNNWVEVSLVDPLVIDDA